MDLRSLQCFIALAEELHFGRAADRANISQPGLSGQIQRLEKRLGAKLFERSTRRVSLTAVGAEFLPHARSALRSLERGLRKVRTSRARDGGHLAIAVTNICAEWGAYDLISLFSECFPKISVETRELTSNLQEEGLARGGLDVGFLHPPLREGILFEQIGQDDFGVAFREDHPLAEKVELGLVDLTDQPLIIFPRENGPNIFGRIEDAFQRADVRLNIIEFATPLTLSLRAAAAGRGIAFVSESYAGGLPVGLVYRRIRDFEVSLPIAIGWHADCQNEAVDIFRAHCKTAMD